MNCDTQDVRSRDRPPDRNVRDAISYIYKLADEGEETKRHGRRDAEKQRCGGAEVGPA